jgi:NAD(P)-dependent dehydrogenase (short-subunit alcohol dehydrogenase family)
MAELLQGKVAVVTGGSSGIGRATSIVFAREGAKVIVSDVDVDGGAETVNMVTAHGGEGLFVRCDVSKADEVQALIDQTVATYGRLDCGFNNAWGLGQPADADAINSFIAPPHECAEESWDRVIDICLKGVWLCMKYQIQQMLKQGGGAIVNTASALGLVGLKGHSTPYIASKHGVIGLTKTAALEYSTQGIRVNAVCPGTIRTAPVEISFAEEPTMEDSFAALHPIGRIGEPKEVAEAVVWLCSEAASFVTGHALSVDGGFTAQ